MGSEMCIRDRFKKNGDGFGHMVFSAVFGQSNLTPEKGFEVDAKDPTKEKLNDEEQSFLDFFQKTALGKNCK